MADRELQGKVALVTGATRKRGPGRAVAHCLARGDDRVPLPALDDDVWRKIVDVNLNGTMLCCKYASRQMIAQGDGDARAAAGTSASQPYRSGVPAPSKKSRSSCATCAGRTRGGSAATCCS